MVAMLENHYVYYPCQKQWLPFTNKDVFINISEGPQGEDIEVFTCGYCGKDHSSVVRG